MLDDISQARRFMIRTIRLLAGDILLALARKCHGIKVQAA
jgi:hypothetical protein